jgi:hypothetical protein
MKASRNSFLLRAKRRLTPSLHRSMLPTSGLDVTKHGRTSFVVFSPLASASPLFYWKGRDYCMGGINRNETRCWASSGHSPPEEDPTLEQRFGAERHHYGTVHEYYEDENDHDDEDTNYRTYSDKTQRPFSNNNKRRKQYNRNDIPYDEGVYDEQNEYATKRIWLDPQAPIQDRVSRFVNQPLGSLHPLDVKLASVDLIRECGKLKSFNGMKLAQDILDRLIEEKRHVNLQTPTWPPTVIPDRPFKMVMYGWSNLCRKVQFAPQRMRDVLDLMIQESEYDKTTRRAVEAAMKERGEAFPPVSTHPSSRHGSENGSDSGSDDAADEAYDTLFEARSCEPTVDIYNTLLQGLSEAATSSIAAAIEAQDALSTMERMHRTRGWHTKPNTRSYSLVLNAYAKARHTTSGSRAEAVLRNMIISHEADKQAYQEEYEVEYDENNPSANHRRIVTPDTVAYTNVIQAYGQSDSPDAADNALRILSELLQSDKPALTPDAFAFANTINAFSRMADQKRSPQARLDAAQRAEDVLWLMVEEVKNSPDVRNAEGRHPLAGSIVPFNASLNAWARSFTAESPHRAERLLRQLLDPELQQLVQVYPNTVSFNTCMQAWAKSAKVETSSAPERAEELLRLLQELSTTSDNDGDMRNSILKPDVQSYVTVMNAYASSRGKQSVYHVRRLFNELFREGQYLADGKPITAAAFTVVFKAAAKAGNVVDSGKDDFSTPSSAWIGDETNVGTASDPYLIALETYSELQNDTFDLRVTGDHFAYAAMVDVIAVHTDVDSIERRQRVEEIFHDACEAGHVSSLVVKSLQKACPNEFLLKDLLRLKRNVGGVISMESINIFPKQWTRFVPPEFRRISSRSDHFRKEREHFRSHGGGTKKEIPHRGGGNYDRKKAPRSKN